MNSGAITLSGSSTAISPTFAVGGMGSGGFIHAATSCQLNTTFPDFIAGSSCSNGTSNCAFATSTSASCVRTSTTHSSQTDAKGMASSPVNLDFLGAGTPGFCGTVARWPGGVPVDLANTVAARVGVGMGGVALPFRAARACGDMEILGSGVAGDDEGVIGDNEVVTVGCGRGTEAVLAVAALATTTPELPAANTGATSSGTSVRC